MLPELRELRVAPDDRVLLAEDLVALVLEFDLVEEEFLTALVGLVARVVPLVLVEELDLVLVLLELTAFDNLPVE